MISLTNPLHCFVILHGCHLSVRTLRQSLRASRGYSHVRLHESPEHGAVSQSTLPSSTQSDSEAAANSSSATTGSSDDDVCQETQRVLTGQTDGDMLILKNLTKVRWCLNTSRSRLC